MTAKSSYLVLKIFLGLGCGLMLLVALAVGGLIVYAMTQAREFENLTDTHDLPRHVDKFASEYVASRPKGRLAVGVSQRGKRYVKEYGVAADPPRPDGKSVYEIGSITKVFTGIALAYLEAEGDVKLSQTIGSLLPETTKPLPQTSHITLRQLATHTSGLPRLPGNIDLEDPNPYAKYSVNLMFEDLEKVKTSGPTKTSNYSNYGVGLLGQLLADQAGKSYDQLIRDTICDPLLLSDTRMTLNDEQRSRLIAGVSPDHSPAPAWEFDALAGAGALRSTIDDLLKFLEANLHPPAGTLGQALKRAQEKHFESWTGSVGLCWQISDDPYIPAEIYWHNGGTAGYCTYAAFNKEHDVAVVILSNYGDAFAGDTSVDDLGRRILGYATKISLE